MPQKILNELSTRCEKSVEHLKSTMLGVRTGRAHPALVEEIKVDYFGTPTPIKNMGSVNVPEARQIVITPWDKTAMKAIEKAIQSSSLGITPQNDGSSIRLNLPELTQQRRVELDEPPFGGGVIFEPSSDRLEKAADFFHNIGAYHKKTSRAEIHRKPPVLVGVFHKIIIFDFLKKFKMYSPA